MTRFLCSCILHFFPLMFPLLSLYSLNTQNCSDSFVCDCGLRLCNCWHLMNVDLWWFKGHLIIYDVDWPLLAIKLLRRQYRVAFLLNNNIGKCYSTMNIKPFLFAGYFLVFRKIVKFQKFAVIVQFGWHLTKAYGRSSLAWLIWA